MRDGGRDRGMSGNGPDQALSIAAIATAVAPGQGGIAVIRLSGPSAVHAVAAITVIAGQPERLQVVHPR